MGSPVFRDFKTRTAKLDGIAKPMPTDPPDFENMAVLMPTRPPSMVTKAPPEFPGLIAASVWMKPPTPPSPAPVRDRAEIMPLVTVCPTPNGLPMARTKSPTSNSSESLKVNVGKSSPSERIFKKSQIRVLVGPDQSRVEFAPVRQNQCNPIGPLDNMMVGDDISVFLK